jgi:hypothetical protein
MAADHTGYTATWGTTKTVRDRPSPVIHKLKPPKLGELRQALALLSSSNRPALYYTVYEGQGGNKLQ